MSPVLKRGLARAAVVLLVLLAIPVSLFASAFIGTSALADAVDVGDAVRVVKDGFVAVGFIDLGAGQVALVDAGVDKEGKAILAELARRKLGPDAVVAILLTHGHGDHLAGAHLFPKARVYALEPDVALAEGRVGSSSPMGRLAGAKPTGVKIERGLADGEALALGARTVRVFALPGHTGGSAAYLVAGALFLGDSAGSSKDGKILGAPWVFSDNQTQNRVALHLLAERLRPMAAEVKTLVPAHSGVLQGLEPLAAFVP